MKKVIYLSAILLMLAGCHDMRVSEKLDQVDSLVVREQYDSAYVVLNNLDGTAMAAEDQAHYYLQKTQLGYLTNQPLPSDSLLDFALAYYNKVGNDQKLADAYYYKSYRSEIDEDYLQAIMYCKEAERLATKVNDLRLHYKISESLAYLNGLCENDLLQLKYAKKSLELAQSVQNNSWIVWSYNRISYAYANLDRYDSALIYIEKSIPYLDYVYETSKAQYLTNVGQLFKDNNPKKAKEFLRKH